MSRRARTRTSLLGLAGILLLVPILWASNVIGGGDASGGSGGSGEPGSFVVPDNFKVKLLRAGLDPSALAACGVVSNGTLPVLQAAADVMNANPSTLSSADAAYATARVQVDSLQRKIQSGLGSSEDLSAYQSATASLASATSARQSALNAIFNAAGAAMTEGQRTKVALIRSNRAATTTIGTFPTEFLVVERIEAQWVALREALANERISAEVGDTPNAQAQASLATWRADGAVSSAKSSLDSNLASLTASWNAAAGQQ